MDKKTKKRKKNSLEKLDHGQLTIDDYKRAMKINKKLTEIFKIQTIITQ